MTLPQHNLTIRDGGLGLIAADSVGLSVKIGSSTTGTAATFYSYQGTDVQTVFDDLGEGPLPHATAKHLLRSAGKPVLSYKATPSNAGASSAITRSGGSVGPLPTLSAGTANDQYDSQIVIVLGGAVGTATFKYTLDGGDTWSDTILTAGTYLLPSGVTVTFTAGTYVANEAYAWTDTAPSLSSADIGTAVDAVIVSAYDPEAIHVLGQAVDAAGTLTIATLLATKVTAAWAAHKYLWIAFESPAVAASLLITAFANFIGQGVVGFAGFCELVNDKDSRIQKRSIGRTLMPRIMRNPLAVHALRRVGDEDIESLPDVYTLVPDGAAASTGYHDEQATPGLDAARFSTLRTIPGAQGFYPSNALTFASSTSDFLQLPYLRIILQGARVWYQYGLTQLGARIRTNPDTGFIAGAFADAIETGGEAAIRANLGDAIEAVEVLVNRTDDVTADPTLRAKVRLVVGGYVLTFDSEIGLASQLSIAA